MSDIRRNLALRSPRGSLLGQLCLPEYAQTLILMPQTGPHPTHAAIHAELAARNMAVLTIELLTTREAAFPGYLENPSLLAERLTFVLDFVCNDGDTGKLTLGLFAADHAAPAALRCAARRDQTVRALVTLDGFIDRAGKQYLEALAAPLLVLSNPDDTPSATATRRAFEHLHAPHELRLIEPHEAATETVAWFKRWLTAA